VNVELLTFIPAYITYMNEPRTNDIEAACPGQIEMAETRDNGHVFDKLWKKKIYYAAQH